MFEDDTQTQASQIVNLSRHRFQVKEVKQMCETPKKSCVSRIRILRVLTEKPVFPVFGPNF